MKYIRTKDGRIVEVEEHMMIKETTIDGVQKCFRLVYKDQPFTCVLRGDEDYIIKQADTIEELCDEFVIKDNDCGLCYLLNDESKYAIQYHIKDQIDILVNDFKMQNDTCYGAIWTDKGLIYVAKMNEKGELELL